ncbi:MAG: flagellar basal body P-ring formation chaperone FlgA, partial [Campylobacterota bacterium]
FMRYEIRANIERLVATKDIDRGQSVNMANVAKKMVPWQNSHREYIQTVQNSVARYHIAQGTAITKNMVEQTPDVKRGHTIKCRFKQDNIIIEFDATALSDGVVGEEIRVQKGLEIYKAKILAKNLVEIL